MCDWGSNASGGIFGWEDAGNLDWMERVVLLDVHWSNWFIDNVYVYTVLVCNRLLVHSEM